MGVFHRNYFQNRCFNFINAYSLLTSFNPSFLGLFFFLCTFKERLLLVFSKWCWSIINLMLIFNVFKKKFQVKNDFKILTSSLWIDAIMTILSISEKNPQSVSLMVDQSNFWNLYKINQSIGYNHHRQPGNSNFFFLCNHQYLCCKEHFFDLASFHHFITE